MSNTYFKIINKSLGQKYANSVINSIHDDMKTSISTPFNMLNFNNRILKNSDEINQLIKYYILNQIAKESEKNTSDELNLTANSNIKVDENNHFYKLKKNMYQPAPEITKVFEDGKYLTEEKIKFSRYTKKCIIDKDDSILSIQLINNQGKIEQDINSVIEILGMRKEYALKFKYSGYSGCSCFTNCIINILNYLNSPIETGYYMDNKYNLYKWDYVNCLFIHNPRFDVKSPLLTDYYFKSDKIVVRKEYIGNT